MVDQASFRVIIEADPRKFPDYEATHGLPKSIVLIEAEQGRGTNLLTAAVRGLDLNRPKHTRLSKAPPALMRDAYLLWRLSERYGEEPFRIGRLDKDRLMRLQFGGIELVECENPGLATEVSFIRVCWGRRSLNSHYGRLRECVVVE